MRTTEPELRNAKLRQSEKFQEVSWQLLQTQDEERRHIARELHDSAGQVLTLLSMSLTALLESVKQKAPDLIESVVQSDRLVQQLTREIRTTSYLLHPPLLDEVGLSDSLSWYIDGLRQRSGLEIDFNISEEFGRLPRDMELAVFRLVQECLTNIHRHSGSKVAYIQISREPQRISVQVRDRGKGISPEKLAEIQTKGSGVGIRGMRERLRQFHGEMTIESSSSGTTILGTMPLFEELPAIALRVNLTECRATTYSGAKALGGQEIIRPHYQSPFRIECRGRGKVETGIGNGRS
jgi:two-component system NarL family sensor kinase